MRLHALDIAIIVGYFVAVILIGLWVSRRGAKDLDSYLFGGKSLPWYMLGVSDASGMFDISGTMRLIYGLFLYGLKCVWLPWVWMGDPMKNCRKSVNAKVHIPSHVLALSPCDD